MTGDTLEAQALVRPAMIIAGEPAHADQSFPVMNPATEGEVGLCPDIDRATLDRAVAAARQGFKVWKDTPLNQRRAAMRKAADRIDSNVDEIARILTAEQGKPLALARHEVASAAKWMRLIAEQELPVEVLQDDDEMRIERHRIPLGVVVAIAPWNFPIRLGYWKVTPALLTGNAVILKPSPYTPLSSLMIAELIHDLFPAGVLTTVAGGDTLGPWLTEHPDIDKVSFTGSSATGSRVMASASHSLKRVTLELGGNDAAVVLPDVDVDKVAERVFWAAFRNSGQVCIASKRIFVHDDIYDAFRDRMVALAQSVRVGDPAEDGIDLGPIQNRMQFDKVSDLIADCKARGYTLHQGSLDASARNRGLFVPVTIVDNPPDAARIVQEEPFGPVLPLMRFSDVDEVIERVNASEYGLGGSVWTRDLTLGAEIANRIESGIVWVNDVQTVTPVVPFGGIKRSGMGVESGLEGLAEYTAGKTIVLRQA